MLATNDWLENTGKFSIKLEQIDNCRGWLQFFVCNPWRILAEGGAPTPGQPSFIIRPGSALPGHYLRVILPGPRRYITRYTCLRCNLARPERADDPLKLQNSALKYPLLELSARYFIQKEELPGLGPLRHPGQICRHEPGHDPSSGPGLSGTSSHKAQNKRTTVT